MTRLLLTMLVVIAFIGTAAEASGVSAPPAHDEGLLLQLPVTSNARDAEVTVVDLDVLPIPATTGGSRTHSLPFSFLYVTNAALQGFDAYSTLKAMDARGVERNPLMAPVLRSRAGFLAVKVSAATVAIVAAEQLRKRDHRLAALLLMLGSNSFMACVAMNNARVLATR